MTLEKIRAALPTHIMLTPGVHRWREGDEIYLEREDVWERIDYPQVFGNLVLPGDHNGRRPIPPHILDNQAFWVRFGIHASVGSGTPAKYKECECLTGNESGKNKWQGHAKAGRLYDKWLLEQMDDV